MAKSTGQKASQNKPSGALPLSVTIKQGCSELQVGRTTLDALIKSGRLKVFKVGSRGLRIARSELLRFMEGESS